MEVRVKRQLGLSVVMITRNRRHQAVAAVTRLLALPEVQQVVIVDNGSEDDTVAALRSTFDEVVVLAASTNLGAAGRTLGIQRATCEYVAFTDDDSGWAPASLRR